ncbi:Hypoxanthine/guanine phosphoribosyltransferase [Diplonema papillatum]|nr:Hypoxanthine/guanine phosphoribosyltransferase [Diplonema papillatum]|eukprot:gene1752-2659_t
MTATREEMARGLFEDRRVVPAKDGSRRAVLPLTDFHPAVRPESVVALAELLNALLPADLEFDCFIGFADRATGPLVHLLGQLRSKPYTLANWYPAGSIGDITIQRHGGFTGEDGVVLINSLKPGMRVVFVDDIIQTGEAAVTVVKPLQEKGIEVVAALIGAAVEELGGRKTLKESTGVETTVLVTYSCASETTKVVSMVETPGAVKEVPACPSVDEIGRMDKQTLEKKYERVLNAFVGVPVYRADNSEYPYCNFALTDFKPMLEPELVEDMADCMVHLSTTCRAKDAQLVVSEGDRGGGPLVLAVARRVNLPFSMANWNRSADIGVATAAQVGYSGHGNLYLNGVTKGDRCVVVDDMLSSGGTAEGLFRSVVAAGGSMVEALFASEKTTTKGRARLGKEFGDVRLLSLCYFSAGGECTVADTPTYAANSTPIQSVPSSS